MPTELDIKNSAVVVLLMALFPTGLGVANGCDSWHAADDRALYFYGAGAFSLLIPSMLRHLKRGPNLLSEVLTCVTAALLVLPSVAMLFGWTQSRVPVRGDKALVLGIGVLIGASLTAWALSSLLVRRPDLEI